MGAAFAERLNYLFESIRPLGRGPFLNAEVVDAVRSMGVRMSAPYMSQLRRGERTNPSLRTINAIAAFFRIMPEYFTDEQRYTELHALIGAMSAVQREDDVREMTLRFAQLSPEARRCLSKSTHYPACIEHHHHLPRDGGGTR